jgi:ankyrin repeat protein
MQQISLFVPRSCEEDIGNDDSKGVCASELDDETQGSVDESELEFNSNPSVAHGSDQDHQGLVGESELKSVVDGSEQGQQGSVGESELLESVVDDSERDHQRPERKSERDTESIGPEKEMGDISGRQNERPTQSLYEAARKGDLAAVQRLLKPDFDIHADSKDEDASRTALSYAAEFGHEAVVRLLIEQKAEADSRDKGDRTPLSWAAENGHEEVVRLLVEREDVEADSKDNHNQTPLSWAAEKGHEAVVRLLVEREDVEADSKDNTDRTPLSWAAENGHEAVVRLLVELEDVEADSKDNTDRTPLSWAAMNGHESVVRLLVEREDVETDSTDMMYGRTPLSWAAKSGRVAVVRLLLEREDVDADSRDNWDQTALYWAIERRHEEVARLLESKDSVSRSKLSYGVVYSAPHRESSTISTAQHATDRIDWFIYRGQQIKQNEYSHRFSRTYTNTEPNRKWKDMVVAAECFGFKAPDSLWDEKVKLVCIVESELPKLGSDTTDVKGKHAARSITEEATGYKVFYEIKFVFKNSDPTVEVWSWGQKIGSSEVEWKGESGQYLEKKAGILERPMKEDYEEEEEEG